MEEILPAGEHGLHDIEGLGTGGRASGRPRLLASSGIGEATYTTHRTAEAWRS
jgi:hypothetical protein